MLQPFWVHGTSMKDHLRIEVASSSATPLRNATVRVHVEAVQVVRVSRVETGQVDSHLQVRVTNLKQNIQPIKSM